MAQVLMGKLLPNLKITLGNEASEIDDNPEEGEIRDTPEDAENNESVGDQKQSVEFVRSWINSLPAPKVYENKNGAFITGLDLSSEVVIKKLEERAARFGLERKDHVVTQDEINTLYKSMGIDFENKASYQSKNIRLDAIHMRGVNEMNTNEIFQYFRDYGPASVEWINDFSCNVVWMDEASTARALLGLSQPLELPKKKETKDEDEKPMNEDDKTMNEDDKTMNEKATDAVESASDSEASEGDAKSSSDNDVEAMDVDSPADSLHSDDNSKLTEPVAVPVPPGHWRLGIPHSKAKAILLRFATKDDKKLPGAEKRSQYYQKYGNPNYGGLTGLISASRKRKMQAARNRQVIEKLTEDSSAKSPLETDVNTDRHDKITNKASRLKEPRMRMYADDEEEKKKATKHRFEHRSSKRNVYSRLGAKYTKNDLYHLGSKFPSNDEDSHKVPANRKVSTRFNIWTDIAKSMAEEENRSSHRNTYERTSRSSNDLRSTINFSSSSRRKNIAHGDLRSKIKRMREDHSSAKQRSRLKLSNSESEDDY